MMSDEPIAHTKDGRPVFDNTPTVVVGLAVYKNSLLVIRRNNNPRRNRRALPGGYHMRGETWEQALAREVKEETGIVVKHVSQVGSVMTDEYGNNLIFGIGIVTDPTISDVNDGESYDIMFTDDLGDPVDWAFPLHYQLASYIIQHMNAERDSLDDK